MLIWAIRQSHIFYSHPQCHGQASTAPAPPVLLGSPMNRGTKMLLVKGSKVMLNIHNLPSGKRLHNYGKSPFLMGKLTINHHFQ
jgi:hypothetical protein